MWVVEGKVTVNDVCMMRSIIESSLEVNKDLHLCLIDYTTVYDRIRHVNIVEKLADLQIDGKDNTLIKTYIGNNKLP